MSSYADVDDVRAYVEGDISLDDFALERLIRRAETDLDLILIPLRRNLPPSQVIAIPGASGGTFTLGMLLDGVTSVTPGLPEAESPAALQSALEALPQMASSVSGVAGTNPWTVLWDWTWSQTNFEFGSNWSIPNLVLDASGITPSGIVGTITAVKGRKVDPFQDLDENRRIALSNAVCAQTEYRLKLGSNFFVKPQYDSVKGPDFQTSGRLPRVGPRVKDELAGTGLLWTGGRVVAGSRRIGVRRGWANY